MSKFRTNQTTMNDAECLEGALKELGHQPQVHKNPVQLYGYQGDRRKETAEIVLPRKTVGSASNDVGFKKDAHGNFQAIISDYDRSIGYNEQWLGKVELAYGKQKVKKIAADLDLEFTDTEVQTNGDIKVRYVQRA